jgi:hypothetical protein
MAMLVCIKQVTQKLRNLRLQDNQIIVDKSIDGVIINCTIVMGKQISKINDLPNPLQTLELVFELSPECTNLSRVSQNGTSGADQEPCGRAGPMRSPPQGDMLVSPGCVSAQLQQERHVVADGTEPLMGCPPDRCRGFMQTRRPLADLFTAPRTGASGADRSHHQLQGGKDQQQR